MGWFNRFISAVGIMPAAMGFAGSSYDAGNYGTREMEDWHPPITSADDEILESREAVVARARDLYRNHPVIFGAVNKIADAVIGSRVLLDANPMHELLKKNLEWALDWSLGTEAEFKAHAYSPRFEFDVLRQNTYGQIKRTQLVTRIVDGECFHIIRNKASGSPRYTTCIEQIDPDRVCNPMGMPENHRLPNGNTVYAGIECKPDGEPVAYHVRVRHPAQIDTQGDGFKWVRVPRFTASGKPVMVHSFRQHRPNQRRGISGLVSVIKRVRMNDNYDIAELEAALFDAINAGYVTSPYPSGDVAAGMAPSGNGNDTAWSLEKQIEFRKENKVRLKGTRMSHLFPGEKMEWKQPARPAGNYAPFKGAGQHDMAAGTGLSYPQLSEDWADINYSSARTLLNEKWRGFDSLGEEFTSQCCAPDYDAWLEEAIAIGTIKMPGGAGKFYSNRSLISFCSWLRPGRGKIDPLKEEQAADIAVHAGRSNTSIECAQNGLDLHEVLLGKAREERLRKKLGLDKFVPIKVAGGASSSEDGSGSSTKGTEDDRDGDGIANESEREKERRDQRRKERTGATQ